MEFLDFLKKAPTAFHAVAELSNILDEFGYIKLNESENWKLELGEKYYVTRNNSTIIAFHIPKQINGLSYNVVCAHTDSPTFKLKPNYRVDKYRYQLLDTEVYGGAILNTWMDRPLNIAGRVIIKSNQEMLKTKLISFDKPIAVIPNCSIHYNRELNDGVKLNPQIELIPLVNDKDIEEFDLLELIAAKLNIKVDSIVSHDLYLSTVDRGSLVGFNDEFIVAPQIDNLECSYAALRALTMSEPSGASVNVCALFDNEEIGSRTKQGAGSTLLEVILRRISNAFNLSYEDHQVALANSFIISADNAQGFHPNYSQKYDMINACFMNNGVVIKTSAKGSYTTDALSLAYFKSLCEKAGAKYQTQTNKSDINGGSTLGAILLSSVSVMSVDIGLPQIAMHSAMETAGRYDYDELLKVLKEFYQTHITLIEDGIINFK